MTRSGVRDTLLMLLLSAAAACGQEGGRDVIFDMETVRHTPTQREGADKQQVPIGTAELVDGHAGRACRFTFSAGTGFFTANVKPGPAWDQAAGFSFWVKGDGSKSWGGLELINPADFRQRYGFCFPLDATEWQKIVVRWSDLMPEVSGPMIDAKAGLAPSQLGCFWFGKWWYWRDYPPCSYTIDDVALEPVIPAPAAQPAPGAPLARLRARLAGHQPVTVVTMGDSLSDKRHWSNQDQLWSELLVQKLHERYQSEVKLVNPAMGGTALNHNVVVLPRWIDQAPEPDLVTIWFGSNDWDNGVRGHDFQVYLTEAVDRIRRMTRSQPDIVLMTTCPGHAKWDTMRELEEAARAVAVDRQCALVDVAAEFRHAGDADTALTQGYFAWDKVHLGAKGKQVAVDAVLRAIAGE